MRQTTHHTCYSGAFGYGDVMLAMYAGSRGWRPCELDARSIGDDTVGLGVLGPQNRPKGESMTMKGLKRYATLLSASALLALTVAAGAALAATFDCADTTGDICTGTYKDDTMHGTEAPDKIDALSGADTASGLKGADELLGARGDDTLYGGPAEDYIHGESDSDTLYGKSGDDYLVGGNGYDTIYGGGGSEEIYAGSADDTIIPGPGIDKVVNCGQGNDVVIGAQEGEQLRYCEVAVV
jgi:Ca2+-binding RTX toxin-like protein